MLDWAMLSTFEVYINMKKNILELHELKNFKKRIIIAVATLIN